MAVFINSGKTPAEVRAGQDISNRITRESRMLFPKFQPPAVEVLYFVLTLNLVCVCSAFHITSDISMFKEF